MATNEILGSTERRKLCKKKVTQLYMQILGRKPDAGGLKHYVRQCFNQHRLISAIRQQLLNSKEYSKFYC